MNRDRRDYYELLGIARDADQQTIKQAYRARARDLHPDISGEPDADERFTELARAYSTLSRPERRILYDRYGYLGSGNGGFDPSVAGATAFRHGSAPAVEFAELRVGLFEAVRGSRRRVQVASVGICHECRGSGARSPSAIRECDACAGEGRVRSSQALGGGRLLQIDKCVACAGRGTVIESPCAACRGTGKARAKRTLKVEIPPGSEDGGILRVAAPSGGDDPVRRDVYLRLRIIPDRDSRLVRVVAAIALVFSLALFAVLLLAPERVFGAS